MRRLIPILWALVVVYALVTFMATTRPGVIPVPVVIALLTFLPVAFALLHGSQRYGWQGIIVFLAVCLGVSNILENTSILTGFPFGHYYYTADLGPKLFLVPILIGPAYFGIGYVAWTVGTVILGEPREKNGLLATFAVPFIASFVMVAWDVGMDPTNSTIRHNWIWQQGGGYFGVPLTNYLGWSLTVYVFFQIFALYVYFRGRGRPQAESLPAAYLAQATVLYAVIALGTVLGFVVGGTNTPITDAAGVVWQSRSIAEAMATVTIYTMLFATALAAVRLLQTSSVAESAQVPKAYAASGVELGTAAGS